MKRVLLKLKKRGKGRAIFSESFVIKFQSQFFGSIIRARRRGSTVLLQIQTSPARVTVVEHAAARAARAAVRVR